VHRLGGCRFPASRALVLWLQVPGLDGVSITADGRPVAPLEPTPVGGGTRVRVEVPADARSLRVESQAGSFSAQVEPAPVFPEVVAVQNQRTAGSSAEALRLAESALQNASPESGATLLGIIARIHLNQGRTQEAEAVFRRAIEKGEKAGLLSSPVLDACALAYNLNLHGQIAQAREVLDGVRPLTRRFPEGRAHLAYYNSQIASESGNWRAALEDLREADDLAAKFAMTARRRYVRGSLGLELSWLGRATEARDLLLNAFQDEPRETCERGDAAINYGWALYSERATARDARIAERVPDAREVFREAVDVYGRACEDPERRANAAYSLAAAELQHGRVDEAIHMLLQAKKHVEDPGISRHVLWLNLEGRIALARGQHAKARAVLERALALAEASGQRHTTWDALEKLGETLLAQGKLREAAETLERAESVVDELFRGVPLGEGRSMDVGGHEESNRWLVETYLRANRPADAVRAARRNRGRMLLGLRHAVDLNSRSAAEQSRLDEALGAYRRGLEELEAALAKDWELSASALDAALARRRATEKQLRSALDLAYAGVLHGRDRQDLALPSLPPGLSLVIAESPRGIVGFAIDGEGITVHRIGDLDASASAEALAEAMLVPFAAKLRAAQSLHVLLPAWLGLVDVHALPFEGKPLGARLAIDYLADIGRAAQEANPPDRVLVVGDPSSNLPEALAEAKAVAGRLQGPNLDLLINGAATRSAVVHGLEQARLFHYAGHASFGGMDGWDSELLLADDARLTVADILALRHVPRQVVLLGCETARSSAAAATESLSVAHAFVVSGSDFVVAPTRRVPDADSARMAQAFYDAFATGAPDPAEALRAAQSALRNELRDWAAFRVLRP
jgi:tetratricopeptide (TPR) repeat protein